MIARIATHVADSHRDPVAHADDAELGDGVLFEKLRDKLPHISESERVAGGPKIFLRHGGREVDDEDQMANDASLKRGGVLEEPRPSFNQREAVENNRSMIGAFTLLLTSFSCPPRVTPRWSS